jgi:peptidyl-prolyl cis-trans isomerase D
MIQIFRNVIFSKFGGTATVLFILLIAGAFALGDVMGLGGNPAVSSGDAVATVGGEKITAAEFEAAVKAGAENERERNPQLSLQAFIAGGGAESVLNTMIDRAAIAAFGAKHGIVVSDLLVDSEIAKLPAAQGLDGKFSQAAYQQLLAQQGVSDQTVRRDIVATLVAKQILVPAAFGSGFSQEATLRYAALLREHRKGAIVTLPSLSFAPKAPPSEAELQAFYAKTRNTFIRPERRTIRYAVFDASAVKAVAPPSDAEIAARYNANKAKYAASETRKLTQLIVPTEPAARAIAAELAKGGSLAKAATTKGLSTAQLSVTKAQLAAQSSPAVADAAFAARAGSLAAPARSGLGWHVIHVDAVDAKPARSLDQVRTELVKELGDFKQRQALVDFSAKIEEEFDGGSSLTDVAKQLGLTLVTTEPLTADGKVYGSQDKAAPADLTRVIATAFSMERENEPQLAEVEPGKKFVAFDVGRITPSAPAPLADIKNDVATAWAMAKGAEAAKAAGEKMLAQAKKGVDIGTSMASLGVPLPPVDRVDIGREQLSATRQVPPPLALLFSMAQGTTKLLPAPRNRGWYVVSVSEIIPGKIEPNDPMLAAARQELGQLTGREYADQLMKAIRAEVGVERNDDAIKAVKNRLSGDS